MIFADGDVQLVESGVIVEYLEDAYPNEGTALLPKDAAQRAKVSGILKYCLKY